MSDLIVIAYDDELTAETVLDHLLGMRKGYLVDLEDAAVVRRDQKGHLHVTTRHYYVTGGTLTGMFWGLLVGLIFLQPLAGTALRGLIGLVGGGTRDLGVTKEFRDEVNSLVLLPRKSALMAVVRKATPDKVLDEIGKYGGTVLRTSLTLDDENKLAQALRRDRVVAA